MRVEIPGRLPARVAVSAQVERDDAAGCEPLVGELAEAAASGRARRAGRRPAGPPDRPTPARAGASRERTRR